MNPPPPAPEPSAWRGFGVLVGLSFQRHWRVRQMGWVAVGLLSLAVVFVSFNTSTPAGWGFPEQKSRRVGQTLRERAIISEKILLVPLPIAGQGVAAAVLTPNALMAQSRAFDSPPTADALHTDPDTIAANRAAMTTLHANWRAVNFSRWIVLGMFVGFVLPLFTLSYATGAFGTERESRSLVWLMTRPQPRSAIYLAKYLGTLPWCLAFSGGGFVALCLAGGAAGREAMAIYWPAVLAGTVAFAALFHLIGAVFRRPVVVGLVYVFFYEALVAALPGSLKLLSLSFYTRSLMYNEAVAAGLPADMLDVSAPVTPATAWAVLAVVTLGVTGLGMWLFARNEYRDDI